MKVSKYTRILSIEEATGMRIMNPKRKLHLSGASTLHVTEDERIPDLPSLPGLNATFKLGQRLPPDGASLRAIFNTSAPCTIVTSIFRGIDINLSKNAPYPLELDSAANIDAVDHSVLYSGIVDSVQHPPCIITAASAYVKEVLQDKDFVGVHWRYDKDWDRVCVKPFPSWCKFICDHLDYIKPGHVARGIANTLKTADNLTGSIPVYIAAPPSMNDFKNEVYSELYKLNERFIKPAKKLKAFLSEKYETCWRETGWEQIEELRSFCEMEIMVRSSWFFHSAGSTWSENIRPLRVTSEKSLERKFEANLFKLAQEGT